MTTGAPRIRLQLVTGDTSNITLALVDRRTGAPIDVSDVLTVCALKTRPLFGASPPTTSTTCSKLPGRELPNGIDETAPYDTPGRGGRVMASCPAGVFADAGEYEGELEVTFGATSQVGTPYARLFITVRADLD